MFESVFFRRLYLTNRRCTERLRRQQFSTYKRNQLLHGRNVFSKIDFATYEKGVKFALSQMMQARSSKVRDGIMRGKM